ncbi:hypothetical protein GWO43_25510 [candidate division KSB1 bacterium]|nr:hypothetical protein [candidate division KSB1 bacterium]NIT74169.1 hypothetical protein [candidate division KSB1 bacterium]NIX73849.1 hypothetical protein [candidate division KSB1 bacterium]
MIKEKNKATMILGKIVSSHPEFTAGHFLKNKRYFGHRFSQVSAVFW